MEVVASIATPETDKVLALRFGEMGTNARLSGKPREPGPLNGYVRQWWLEGYDRFDVADRIGDGGTEV
jgi:hypothetical protein